MKIITFAFMCVIGFAGIVLAADDFGAPFADQAPAAFSDGNYVDGESPWDVEPAAGAEEEAPEATPTDMDLPASDDAMKQLKALEAEHSNIIVDDLSP